MKVTNGFVLRRVVTCFRRRPNCISGTPRMERKEELQNKTLRNNGFRGLLLPFHNDATRDVMVVLRGAKVLYLLGAGQRRRPDLDHLPGNARVMSIVIT